ncbi:hypothetical protein ACF0H5_008056 [Mactra antiquata]
MNEIDLDVSEQSTRSLTINVRVPMQFERCVQKLDGTRCTPGNAKLWCLRQVLWDASSVDAEMDEPEIVQMNITPLTTPIFGAEEEPEVAANVVVATKSIEAPADLLHPQTGFRMRREYRMLSYQQRQRFHDALNVLYDNGVIDTMARIHRRALRRGGAHDGPAFLPWHRAFLAFFEEELRKVDSRVSLPYWDSSFDDNMAVGPGFSVMWDDEHLGEGSGIVDSGPFANWTTVRTPLRRDIHRTVARGVGSLIRQSKIDTVMSFCRRSDFDRRWENGHNNVHRWVGGTMARSLSASDPVFYMHHAFIDYQWEKFRQRQRNVCSVDPAYDYPDSDDVRHHADTDMIGMTFLKNEDGIADFWTDNWYGYEDTPTCATNCGNRPDLFCDEDINLCVSEVRFDIGFRRKKREAPPKREPLVFDDPFGDRGICARNPYARGCPVPAPPISDEGFVEAMLVHEIPLPPGMDEIELNMKKEVALGFKFPPDNEPLSFSAAEDEPNDCRSVETATFDFLNVAVRGKKVTNRGYSRAAFDNPFRHK